VNAVSLAGGDLGVAAAPPGFCFHCRLPLPGRGVTTAPIEGQPRHFCCPGCQAVCSTIYEAGLQGFYRRTPEGSSLAPPPDPPRDLAMYDLDEVQDEFVPELGRVRDIQLLVEGIHCAACVWLMERTLGALPGVMAASVNLSGKRLRVRWDNERVKLSHIIQRLAQIGYAAVPYDPQVAEGQLRRHNRALLYRIAFAGFAMMNMMWISIALYSGAEQGEFRTLFHWVGLALATPTLLYAGFPFLRGAWTGLRRFHLTMDLPIAIGCTVTYLYSMYVTVTGSAVGSVYYDTLVNFLFVILIGRFLESSSKRQAFSSMQRLLDLQPRGATVLREGVECLVPIRSVKVGDTVLVRPGTQIPVDGTVLEGMSSVDESMLSGESVPVGKRPGAAVSAGSINVTGTLTLRVGAILRNTTLGRIIRLVEEAQASKAAIQSLADRIVPWFVAITLGLACATFLIWIGSDFELALMAATAVLIITCPCAFGMSTPMAISVAASLGARHGILVKNGATLETLSDITDCVFDKTGTLTEGRMQVRGIEAAAGVAVGQMLAQVAALERLSEHSIGRAIRTEAEARHLDVPAVKDFTNVPGCGVRGIVAGVTVLAGTEAWLVQQGIRCDDPLLRDRQQAWERQGLSCVRVAVAGREAGAIAVADQLRPDAAALVAALRAQGIHMTLLSGDRRRVAEAVAARLGGMDVIAEVLPQDKERVIGDLQRQGRRVAMVGDGINDAPALVRADVGIALGSGTDVSIESADIVLISDELDKVHLAIALSRRTLRTIRQNIAISITYNVIMVPLAMMALVTPLVAAISMPVSSLLVIANAARIRTLFALRAAPRPGSAPHRARVLEAS